MNNDYATFEWMHRVEQKLDILLTHMETIMATQAELAAQLNAAKDQLIKVGTETATLITKVGELQTALENAANVTPELQAAADAVIAQAKVVDDLVPDSTEPPTP